MQNTLKEIATGSSKKPTEDNTPQPSYPSYMPGGYMPGLPMLPENLRMPQLPFNSPEFYGFQDNRMYMPGGYTGYMSDQPNRKNSIKKPLSCFQCGGPHMKRSCPQLNSGVKSGGNSQSGKTQPSLNFQGPPQ